MESPCPPFLLPNQHVQWIINFYLFSFLPTPWIHPVFSCNYFPFTRPYPWRRKWHPIPVLSPGKSHGRRSLVGCSPWGYYESDTTERLHFHFSLSCIGEGNGKPLQCSCLENPRDGGAWSAAIYGVTQSRTRLKQPSSSSSNTENYIWYLVVNCNGNKSEIDNRIILLYIWN